MPSGASVECMSSSSSVASDDSDGDAGLLSALLDPPSFVVNYRFELFEEPLTKGQFCQLAIGIDMPSFQFWKLHTPLKNVVPPVVLRHT